MQAIYSRKGFDTDLLNLVKLLKIQVHSFY
jgi:hypothetical protein